MTAPLVAIPPPPLSFTHHRYLLLLTPSTPSTATITCTNPRACCLPQTEQALVKRHKLSWQDDSLATNCRTCKEGFSLFRRKHHCRACGLIFCAECASDYVQMAAHKDKQRVCTGCLTPPCSSRSHARAHTRSLARSLSHAQAHNAHAAFSVNLLPLRYPALRQMRRDYPRSSAIGAFESEQVRQH